MLAAVNESSLEIANGLPALDTFDPELGSAGKSLSRLRFRLGVLWMFVANVVYSFAQWAMLVTITKMGSPETVGQFILALAIAAPIVLFTNLQLRCIQAGDAREAHAFGTYFVLRLITAPIAIVIIALVALVGHWSTSTALVIVCVGLFKSVESFSDLAYGLFQHHERMDYIARSLMLRGPLAALVLGLTFYVSRSLAWSCFAVAVGWLIVLLINDRATAVSVLLESCGGPNPTQWIQWKTSEVVRLVRTGIPLGAIATIWTLNANVPRYLIAHRFGERELGLFGAIAYIHIAGTTLVGALGQSAIPKLAGYYAGGDRDAFRSLLYKVLAVTGAIGLAGIAFAATCGRPFLTAIYSSAYGTYYGVFTFQMVASCCAYIVSVLECALNSTRLFDAQVWMVIGCGSGPVPIFETNG
jgi:O-antigen/teichoic acid export membrane protein